jgi:alpha-L-rhamnosidase
MNAPWITTTAADDYTPNWPTPPWIVPAPGPPTLGEAFYRYTFQLADPSALVFAALHLAGCQRTDIHLNGRLLKRAIHWLGDYEIDLLDHLKPGKNVLALHAHDKDRDLPAVAGAICLRHRGMPPATDTFHLTGPDWRARPNSAPAEWSQIWFDDRSWATATPPASAPKRRPPPPPTPRSVVFTKSLQLPEAPISATARVSALGLYHLRVNGQPATDQALTPGWTEYDLRLEYQTLDLAPLLRRGDNTLELTLGNGWWLLHHPGFRQAGRDTRLTAALQLDLTWADGTARRITTDDSWTARPSATLFNHLYHGEVRDCAPDFGASRPSLPVEVVSPPAAVLVAQQAEPIRCSARIAPLSLSRTPRGSWLADFGENLAGWVELQPPTTHTPRIAVTHAELLRADGSLNTDNLRTARATCLYLNVGPGYGPLAPRFTYHGFRYAEIHGWPPDAAPPAPVACFVHADLAPASTFACSDPLLESLFAATRRTFRANFHAVPSDCPQRDERLGWMADAGNIPDVAALFFDISRFFDKWAVDMADAMRKSGYFPNFAPSLGQSERGAARGTPGWSDAGVTVPWTLFQLYGDRERLAVHYPAMRRHVETMRAESCDGLFAQHGWGDWLAVEESPQPPIGAAYYFRSTDLVAKSAAALGLTADAACYADLRETIRDAYQKTYYNATTGEYATGTQTMQAMPLAFGITPPAEQPRVLARLIANIEAHEWNLTTGFLGTTFLFDALAAAARHDVILRLLRQRDFPSLGRILDAGSTTITEAWNAHLGDDFASHNHFNLGAPAAWLLRYLAGLRPDLTVPGGRRLLIEPWLDGDLHRASGSWTGPAGQASVAWHRDSGGTFHLTATIPPGASAELRLAGRPPTTLSAGVHLASFGLTDHAEVG